MHSLVIRIDMQAMVASIRANPGINAHVSPSENSRPRASTKEIYQTLNYLRGG